jgi:hypothetical protein
MEQDTSYGRINVNYDTKPDFSVEESVILEIKERAKKGYAKYGTTMTRNDLSLRDWAQHALEEALDLAIYLKRIIRDLDAQDKP